MKKITDIIIGIGTFFAVAAAAMVIVWFCVLVGMSIFGTQAFGAELPSIEEPCGMSTEELEGVLKGELKQYAQEFIWAEEDYGINACFLASIAALESGWGEHRFKANNIFGFGRMEFESVPKSIDYVAWYLRKHYLNESGKYYRGGTIADIGKIWCPDGGQWVRLVTGIYGGVIK